MARSHHFGHQQAHHPRFSDTAAAETTAGLGAKLLHGALSIQDLSL